MAANTWTRRRDMMAGGGGVCGDGGGKERKSGSLYERVYFLSPLLSPILPLFSLPKHSYLFLSLLRHSKFSSLSLNLRCSFLTSYSFLVLSAVPLLIPSIFLYYLCAFSSFLISLIHFRFPSKS